jgi:hypothetical protein
VATAQALGRWQRLYNEFVRRHGTELVPPPTRIRVDGVYGTQTRQAMARFNAYMQEHPEAFAALAERQAPPPVYESPPVPPPAVVGVPEAAAIRETATVPAPVIPAPAPVVAADSAAPALVAPPQDLRLATPPQEDESGPIDREKAAGWNKDPQVQQALSAIRSYPGVTRAEINPVGRIDIHIEMPETPGNPIRLRLNHFSPDIAYSRSGPARERGKLELVDDGDTVSAYAVVGTRRTRLELGLLAHLLATLHTQLYGHPTPPDL